MGVTNLRAMACTGRRARGPQITIVISNARFTGPAQRYAEGLDIRLLDRDDFTAWVCWRIPLLQLLKTSAAGTSRETA
ncbi:restriction endonuclease [Streptomyces sp. NPDC059161]|uniref:restriction endonuclease n=1 Tax=Streptomyces sp. NPDC059161 TaxID=3346749 RepID=UPI003681B718